MSYDCLCRTHLEFLARIVVLVFKCSPKPPAIFAFRLIRNEFQSDDSLVGRTARRHVRNAGEPIEGIAFRGHVKADPNCLSHFQARGAIRWNPARDSVRAKIEHRPFAFPVVVRVAGLQCYGHWPLQSAAQGTKE